MNPAQQRGAFLLLVVLLLHSFCELSSIRCVELVLLVRRVRLEIARRTTAEFIASFDVSAHIARKTTAEFITRLDVAAYVDPTPSLCVSYSGKLVTRESLRRQYADKLPSEPRVSSLKKAAISNIIPDPDVP